MKSNSLCVYIYIKKNNLVSFTVAIYSFLINEALNCNNTKIKIYIYIDISTYLNLKCPTFLEMLLIHQMYIMQKNITIQLLL